MALSEAARAARNEYLKAWRAKNADRVKEYKEAYWERKALRAKREHDEEKNAR